ncbi:MAG: ATP synthase F1 subunit gamma [Deltaproteobacteria bacterium]|nr:ATP synthase F1 subunit gamma [Deltaproteobacteria bacterium]
MATLRDIRRRISSIQKTRQITRAMQMIAAARLRRAQETTLKWRSYVEKMTGVVERLIDRTGEKTHPLLASKEPQKLEILVITSDKGLCGGFNLSVCQRVDQFIAQNREKFEDISLTVIGKKGRDYFKKRPVKIRQEFVEVLGGLSDEWIKSLSKGIIDDYLADTFDTLYLFYHRFKSVLQQVVVEERQLPLKEAGAQEIPIDYLFEPDRKSVLDKVLPQYLEARVYAALYESITSEHAARMSAMNLATKNAIEMIDVLTLTYNKVRQEVITTELMDIVGGAEALR